MISEGKDDPVKLTTGKPVETSSMFKTNSIFTYISEGLNSIEMPLADKNCKQKNSYRKKKYSYRKKNSFKIFSKN